MSGSEPQGDPRDLRPLGLAGVAWASMWVASSGEPALWLGGALAVIILTITAARHRSRYLAALALLAASCLAAGTLRVWHTGQGAVAELGRERAVAVVDLVVEGDSHLRASAGTKPDLLIRPARVVHLDARGLAWTTSARVEVIISGELARAWAEVPMGARVRAVVSLAAPEPDAGLAALARAREPPTVLAPPAPVDAAVTRVRAGLREASAPLPPEARALLPALVVGDTSGMDADLTQRFRTTGLTHLTAVSGANLTLLLAFLRVAAVTLGVRGRALTGVLIAGVAAFVALCLGEPSVLRAAAMGLVGVAALGWNSGRHGLRYLAVAALGLLVIDPWLARSVGFALSVVASLGLLWWAEPWTAALRRWLPRWAAEAIAVPLAAQLATEPIVVALAGRVSVVGLLANAAAAPLVGPATVLGFLAAGLSVVWLPAARALAWLGGGCAQALCWIARLGDALPGAAVPWPVSGPGLTLVALACLAASVVIPRVLARPWLALGVAAAMVGALLRAPAPWGWPPQHWAVAFCDVGQGDATLVRAGPGAAVLVDAGPDPRALERCLASLGVTRLPLVVLTHLHADHVSGLPAVRVRQPDHVVTSSVTTPPHGEAIVRAASVGAQRSVAVPGSTWSVGEATVTVLAARQVREAGVLGEGESAGENDASLVLRVDSGGVSVLLAGDSEEGGQNALLGLGDALDVDVLLVPHHGSARQSPAFLARTRPEVAVVSVGARNDYGHPTAKTLRVVAGIAPRLARTDTDGAVAVARVDGRLVVTTTR